MNFLITNDHSYQNDLSLNEIYHKDFKILFDDHWIHKNNSLVKGLTNNYCSIKFGDTIELSHNEIRDFPLWYNDSTVSNLSLIHI